MDNLGMIIRDCGAALNTILFALFVRPKKNMSMMSRIGFVLIMVIMYHNMLELYYLGHVVAGIIVEYTNLFLPLVLMCRGNIWKNIMTRGIYQIAALMLYQFLYMVYSYVAGDYFINMNEVEYNTREIGPCLVDFFLTVAALIPVTIIMRAVVLRWKDEKSKSYFYIVLLWLAVGFVFGSNKLKLLAERKPISYEFDFYFLGTASIVMAFLFSAVYNRIEIKRLNMENEYYNAQIARLDRRISGFDKIIEEKIAECEKKGIAVNCMKRVEPDHISDRFSWMAEKMFDYVSKGTPGLLDAGFMERGGYIIADISADTEESKDGTRSPETEMIKKEITEAAVELGGLADFGKNSVSVMVPVQ